MTRLDHAAIAGLIPHAGAMCLLEAVRDWSAAGIACTASSHRDPANPLAARGRLAAVCGIEYACQAVAVHGALIGGAARPRAGLLASARDVQLAVGRLDDVGDLLVTAEQLLAEGGRAIYRFALNSEGRTLVQGRLVVVFKA